MDACVTKMYIKIEREKWVKPDRQGQSIKVVPNLVNLHRSTPLNEITTKIKHCQGFFFPFFINSVKNHMKLVAKKNKKLK